MHSFICFNQIEFSQFIYSAFDSSVSSKQIKFAECVCECKLTTWGKSSAKIAFRNCGPFIIGTKLYLFRLVERENRLALSIDGACIRIRLFVDRNSNRPCILIVFALCLPWHRTIHKYSTFFPRLYVNSEHVCSGLRLFPSSVRLP